MVQEEAQPQEEASKGSIAYGEDAAPPAPEADPAVSEASDPQPGANATPEADSSAAAAFAGELEFLRQELKDLKAAMKRSEGQPAKISDELEEFRALYPNISPDQIPDEVWESARKGVPISAAYALSCRKKERTAELARAANRENATRSTGALEEPHSGYFTPEEVRAMSASEVRKNYSRIMLSMQKWH
ncbi:MAG: hypothetical protein E7620_07160 [Ruminococcaceae bacterium]|nr:hypothetical protein [Oscillospiraceae bacterium]